MTTLATVSRRSLVTAGEVPPTCTLGDTKCVGYDLYSCGAGGTWQLSQHNSPQCGYTPGQGGGGSSLWWIVAAGIGVAVAISVAADVKEEQRKGKRT